MRNTIEERLSILMLLCTSAILSNIAEYKDVKLLADIGIFVFGLWYLFLIVGERNNRADEVEEQREGLSNVYKTELSNMEQLEQTQVSLNEQLQILRPFASKLGLYDAADYLRV